MEHPARSRTEVLPHLMFGLRFSSREWRIIEVADVCRARSLPPLYPIDRAVHSSEEPCAELLASSDIVR